VDGEGLSGDVDDGTAGEVARELLGVESSRHENDVNIFSPREKSSQVDEQEVRLNATFMHLQPLTYTPAAANLCMSLAWCG